jgi:hypothetical protein
MGIFAGCYLLTMYLAQMRPYGGWFDYGFVCFLGGVITDTIVTNFENGWEGAP